MILALDLEGTLISNAVSIFPRYGLKKFIEQCRLIFEEIVIYSAVSSSVVESVLLILETEESLPNGFSKTRIFCSNNRKKDLRFIGDPNNIIMIDDHIEVALEEQKTRFVQIKPFVSPYEKDNELAVILEKINNEWTL